MSDPHRRVLVAIDSSCEAIPALDDAAEMASRIGAELVGLFVEDTNLLKLAGLPCASEIGSATGLSRSLNPGVIERTLKGIAERARLTLARAAERRQVRWSFTTSRGTLLRQLLDAAQSEGTALAESPRGGSRALAMPARSVLLLHLGPCIAPEGTAVILLDGSHASLRNLPTALALADEACTRRTLAVVVSDSPIEARRQRDRVANLLVAESIEAEIRTLAPLDVGALRAFLANVDCGTLVIAQSEAAPAPADFVELIENTGYPVFVIR